MNSHNKIIRSISIMLVIVISFTCLLAGCKSSKDDDKNKTNDNLNANVDYNDENGINNINDPDAAIPGTLPAENSDESTTDTSAPDSTTNATNSNSGWTFSGGGTTTTKKKTSTTNKTTTTSKTSITGTDGKIIDLIITDDGNITTKDGKGVFGFAYSTTDKVFYSDVESWQRNFGYSRVYDTAAPVTVMFFDTSRIYFEYDNKEWMIQLWKGQYGYVLIGAEIGIYNRPAGSSSSTHYKCVDNDEMQRMSMEIYKSGEFLFKRSEQRHWWLTSFVPGQLPGLGLTYQNTKILRMDASITFDNKTMAEAFAEGLRNVTEIAHPADSTRRTFSFKENKNFTVVGNKVSFSWQ